MRPVLIVLRHAGRRTAIHYEVNAYFYQLLFERV